MKGSVAEKREGDSAEILVLCFSAFFAWSGVKMVD